MNRLTQDFFERSPTKCAKALLGCTLHTNECSGIIVETEAYAAENDEACHTFFRKAARDFVNEQETGAAYIYLNYGMYWLLNFLTKTKTGEKGFVLIRAVEPLTGIPKMHERRRKSKALKDIHLCSGPGKLTIAFDIDQRYHGSNFCVNNSTIYLEQSEIDSVDILTGPRIGISKAKELPWRFGIKNSEHLSKPF